MIDFDRMYPNYFDSIPGTQADFIRHKLDNRNWISPENLHHLEIDGMILKKDLIVGHEYEGGCRNADRAVWHGTHFVYMRTKFGSTFPEDIKHPEDDDGYDLFVPIKDITNANNRTNSEES